MSEPKTYTQEEVDKLVGDAKGGKFTQNDVELMIKDRVARANAQYSDYEELKKFKTDHEASQEQLQQEELEKAKKYEEAKKGYETKINELNGLIKDKDNRISSMTIDYALTSEISKNNGYVEESLAILRGQAVLEDGAVKIKGKDSNNQDTQLAIAEGVKQFLTGRPHLVKASSPGGGGTPPGGGNPPPGGGQGTDTLATLAVDLQRASAANDMKKVREITGKINAIYAEKGITRTP